MSTASKVTLGLTTLGAIGIVFAVHYGQRAEKAVSPYLRGPGNLLLTEEQAMHAGVIRDMEQQRLKKERQADFEMQRQLEQEYKQIQNVSRTDSQPQEQRNG